MVNEGSNWTRKKNRVYANYKLQEKDSVTRYANLCFMKMISISWLALHGQFRCKFSKAKKPLCFLITFLSRLCLLSYISIPTCCVTLSKLLLGETIGDKQQLTISAELEFFCKRISSISLSFVSEMTENATAKYVKFWFRATLLINFGRSGSSVIVSVACNLAVLQIMQLFSDYAYFS